MPCRCELNIIRLLLVTDSWRLLSDVRVCSWHHECGKERRVTQRAHDVSSVTVAAEVVLSAVHCSVCTQDGHVVVHRNLRHADSVCACAGVVRVSASSIAFGSNDQDCLLFCFPNPRTHHRFCLPVCTSVFNSLTHASSVSVCVCLSLAVPPIFSFAPPHSLNPGLSLSLSLCAEFS